MRPAAAVWHATRPHGTPRGDAVLGWRGAQRVLLVRLDGLGDVVMTGPAFAAVRASLPCAELTLLASAASTALAPHLPMIDRWIAFDAPWTKPAEQAIDEAAALAGERRILDELRGGRFDAAIVFTVSTQSALPAALWCRQAGIPLRLAHARENPYRLLTDWVPETDLEGRTQRHEVRRQLDLVAAVGFAASDARLRFHVDDRDVFGMRAALAAAGAARRARYFVVHPGATAPSRRYPAERFGRAAARLATRIGAQPVFAGGDADAAFVAAAMRSYAGSAPHGAAPAVSLAGHLTLGEFAALVAGAVVTLCNNSAPAHIAAAVGCPVVVLYALTNLQHTPWLARSRVLSHDVECRGCLRSRCPRTDHACLRKVEPHEVAAAALELVHPAPAALPAPVAQFPIIGGFA
jgi:lipopolysaccharide heptosyltransferase II